jgi:hypothetical protein
MRALYLFLDRTTGVGRPRHASDAPLRPIRSGAFAAWMASAPGLDAGSRGVTGRRTAAQGAAQAAGPSNLPAASRP